MARQQMIRSGFRAPALPLNRSFLTKGIFSEFEVFHLPSFLQKHSAFSTCE